MHADSHLCNFILYIFVHSHLSNLSVNCAVGDWSNSGACSKICGGGLQHQTRTVSTAASGGGTVCPALSRDIDCNSAVCPTGNFY
jgi:hypothetical protein